MFEIVGNVFWATNVAKVRGDDHPPLPTHFTKISYEVDGINPDNVWGDETPVMIIKAGPVPVILYLRLTDIEHIESSQDKSTELEVRLEVVKLVGCCANKLVVIVKNKILVKSNIFFISSNNQISYRKKHFKKEKSTHNFFYKFNLL